MRPWYFIGVFRFDNRLEWVSWLGGHRRPFATQGAVIAHILEHWPDLSQSHTLAITASDFAYGIVEADAVHAKVDTMVLEQDHRETALRLILHELQQEWYNIRSTKE